VLNRSPVAPRHPARAREGFDKLGVGRTAPDSAIDGFNLLLSTGNAARMQRTVSGANLARQAEQQGPHGGSQVDEYPDKATGPRELHRLPQRGERVNGFPLHVKG